MTPPVKPVDLETLAKKAAVALSHLGWAKWTDNAEDTIKVIFEPLIAEVRALREERDEALIQRNRNGQQADALEAERDALRERVAQAERERESLQANLADMTADRDDCEAALKVASVEGDQLRAQGEKLAEAASRMMTLAWSVPFEQGGPSPELRNRWTEDTRAAIKAWEDATESKPSGLGAVVALSHVKPAPPASKPVDRPVDVKELTSEHTCTYAPPFLNRLECGKEKP